MIVVGSRGMGAFGRVMLGSVSSGLVHHAHCPVAIVHGSQAHEPDHTSPVLLGIDGSPASEAATDWPSTKRHVEGSTLWRCTRGAMSASSRSLAWTGTSTRTRDTKCWPNAWRVGKNDIPTCMCGGELCATSPPVGCSTSPSTLSWSWSVVAAAEASRACCWARSALRLPKGRKPRWSSCALGERRITRTVELEMSDNTGPVVVDVNGTDAAMGAARWATAVADKVRGAVADPSRIARREPPTA